jgi:hypothetical protein
MRGFSKTTIAPGGRAFTKGALPKVKRVGCAPAHLGTRAPKHLDAAEKPRLLRFSSSRPLERGCTRLVGTLTDVPLKSLSSRGLGSSAYRFFQANKIYALVSLNSPAPPPSAPPSPRVEGLKCRRECIGAREISKGSETDRTSKLCLPGTRGPRNERRLIRRRVKEERDEDEKMDGGKRVRERERGWASRGLLGHLPDRLPCMYLRTCGRFQGDSRS